MPQVFLCFTTATARSTLLLTALALGCEGTIADPAASSEPSGAVNGSAGERGGDSSRGSGGGTPSTSEGGSFANGSATSGSTSNAGAGGGASTLARVASQYFPTDTATYANKRLVRLTRAQLDATTKTLLPKQFGVSAVATLPRDPLQTNYEYADNLSFNSANFAPFTNWVAGISALVRAAPRSVIDCSADHDSAACLADQAKRFVNRAFRGTLSDAQLTRYSDFFAASVAAVGLEAATADLVDVVLTSPNYVFRDEVSTDDAGSLLPARQLQNITYTLADAPPEALGFDSARASDYLSTSSSAQSTIDRVMARPEARSKLLRFFIAWLEVKEPDEFTIANSVFPEFTPDVAQAVVAETQSFLNKQLSLAAPKMRDITESTESFVPSAAAFLYGNSASGGKLDATQRIGIFTQPAVLASHSGPTTSRLVKRGVFFVRKVMCMSLGAPPPDIDTSISSAAGATERQRVESGTAKSPCSGCHGFINPFGFMLENYDAIGRFRTTDGGSPIDASIQVNFLDEGQLSTNSPVDALRAFTRSFRFQQCFARQLFRFYNGRDETAGDDPLLRQMFIDFATNEEQDIVRMLRTLASSSGFSHRSEVP